MTPVGFSAECHLPHKVCSDKPSRPDWTPFQMSPYTLHSLLHSSSHAALDQSVIAFLPKHLSDIRNHLLVHSSLKRERLIKYPMARWVNNPRSNFLKAVRCREASAGQIWFLPLAFLPHHSQTRTPQLQPQSTTHLAPTHPVVSTRTSPPLLTVFQPHWPPFWSSG